MLIITCCFCPFHSGTITFSALQQTSLALATSGSSSTSRAVALPTSIIITSSTTDEVVSVDWQLLRVELFV